MKRLLEKLLNYTCHAERTVYDLGYDGTDRKRVLISYVSDMMQDSLIKYKYNTNRHECLVIIKIFLDMGYIVDIVSCTDTKFKSQYHYDVVFGFGSPFRNTYAPNRILYVTEAHPDFSLEQEKKRIMHYNHKNNKKAKVTRSLKYYLATDFEYASYIVNLGERNKSYIAKKVDKPIKTVSATGIHNNYQPNKRNDGVKRFLCLTSNGVIHKGVDLLVDYFSKTNLPVELIVAGVSSKEERSLVYKNNKKVKFFGRLDLNSKDFYEIADSSQFVINASCSEGCSTAVLTGLRYGLLPVITDACNVECIFKIVIEDDLNLGVKNAVEQACALSFDEISLISKEIWSEANKLYTLDNFKLRMNGVLNQILIND